MLQLRRTHVVASGADSPSRDDAGVGRAWPWTQSTIRRPESPIRREHPNGLYRTIQSRSAGGAAVMLVPRTLQLLITFNKS